MTISNNEKSFTSYAEKNPFCILSVSCLDDRRKILSAAEEMSFLSDADECTDAQNTLITPGKRLSAELDWFIETDISVINEIKTCLNNNTPILTDNLNALSKLNAMIYNCCISDESDSLSLEPKILDIDKQFGKLNPTTLTEIINNCRRIAKMAEATASDVSIELNKKRERIRSIISRKLQLLKEPDYIELVTLFAEKYIASYEYNDSGIISDIIDQYELWAKSIIDTKEEQIRDCIEKIKSLNKDDLVFENAIDMIIVLIKEWKKYVLPLQVNKAFKGIDDRISLDFAMEIRDLAIYLHNEKDKTTLSLKISTTLRECFSEQTSINDLIDNDIKTLRKLLAEKKFIENQEQRQNNKKGCHEDKKTGYEENNNHSETEADKNKKTRQRTTPSDNEREQHKTSTDNNKNNQSNRQDKKYTVDIFGKKIAIPPFCTCCMKPTENKENISYSITIPSGNSRTTRTIGVDMPICAECLKHRNKHIGLIFLVCSAAVAVAGIIMALLMLAKLDAIISFILSSGVAIGIYYLLLNKLKTKELGPEHSARGKSAEIFAYLTEGILSGFGKLEILPDAVFTFTNREYAELFRDANREHAGSVREEDGVNTAKGTKFLSTTPHHIATMFKMLAVFSVIAIIIGAAISEGDNTSSYSSSPSYSSTPSSPGSAYNPSSSPVEKQFSQSVSSGTRVYANIVSIFPEVGIYTKGSSNYTSFVCRCKTLDDTTVWVHMSVSEYSNNFDSSVSSDIYNKYAEEVTFSTYKEIHGTAETSNSILSGLSSDIGASMLIDFTSVN